MFSAINLLKSLLILLPVVLSILEAAPRRRGKTQQQQQQMLNNNRKDVVCNLGDDHECVCNRTMGNLDDRHLACHEFLETDKIDVVNMVMRDVNLTARLYTNETYEQYLRRRIAQILSQYCENIPEDCPGTLAEIKSRHQQKSSNTLYEVDERTISVLDEDSPIFSRRNIVILRVQYPPGRGRTQIAFVVLKMGHNVGISRADTFDPTKIKSILAAQMAPLSRVLGGIRILQFGVSTMFKPVEPVDNTKLLIMISVVVVLILFCCTVAVVKLLLDKRRLHGGNKNTMNNGRSTRNNYGTCTEKLFFNASSNNNNSALSNGRMRIKSKSTCSSSNESTKGKRNKRQLTTESGNNDEGDNRGGAVTTIATTENNEGIEGSPRVMDYQNIFVCDHSQLPKEDCEEEFEMRPGRISAALNVSTTRSPFSSDGSDGGAFQFPEKNSSDKGLSLSDNIPCVILEDEISTVPKGDFVQNGGEQIQLNVNNSVPMPTNGFLTTLDNGVERCPSRQGGHPPYEQRPLSRRGSFDDEKQEEGEEETFNDTREDTPVPLGDEQALIPKPLLIDMLKNKTKKNMLLLASETDSEQNTEGEDDQQQNELYKSIEDNNVQKEKICKDRMSVESDVEEEEEEEEDEKNDDEMEMLERHQYERLLESPMPPHMAGNAAKEINSEIYFE